ncbi:peptide deformylase [Rhizobium sp. NRK18]|uniref:peptide deformylase n=1 Tax=Rhizobium sp. NRK18 TaxID=2964667 RepID=UPI0021C48A70|nr:peptide deformylase [Rhizobium sp. NRK18]MCQ2004225.1 peptide deformylase [Rhizobium sp. NRK18]
MAVRPILVFPDPQLERKAETVTEFDERLKQLADDLLDTMRAAPGVGITAPHIGVLQRLTVIELDRSVPAMILVNPEIVDASAEQSTHDEGSVSMPGAIAPVMRPKAIRVRYQTLTGDVMEEDVDGFLATCIQHEVDQLDGIFWLKRLSKLKRDRLVKKWTKDRAR